MTADSIDPKLTRASLLGRLKDLDDHESWKEFFETYWKLIYSSALKARLAPQEAEDVVQETILSVTRAMPDFEYDRSLGSFKSWLLKITWRRINDRKRVKAKDHKIIDPEGDAHDEQHPAPEVADHWEQDWERNLMDAAITAVKAKVDPKQYQVFDLGVFKHWDASKISKTLNISKAKVYLTKHRIQRLVKQEIARLKEKYA